MNDQEQLTAGASRRAVLAGGGAACLALLLGACGSSDDKAAGNGAGAPAGGDGSSAPASSAASGTVLAKESDVPSGGGMLVGSVLVVKLADGSIKAYNAHCPHMGTIVQPPRDGKIECPAHHSIFQASDGAKVSGPTP